MRITHPVFVLLTVLFTAGVPTAPAAPTSDASEQLAARLIGFYRGSAPDPAKPGSSRDVFHKIVEVRAPQLGGGTVLYHQIAHDDFDTRQPFVQKFYVFASAGSQRDVVVVTPYSVKPGTLLGNVETSPRDLAQLTAARLQAFPQRCALVWRRDAGRATWVAMPASTRCRYHSDTLKTDIVPQLRYELTADALTMHEVLRDGAGKALFGDAGPLVAQRQPVASTGVIVALSRLSEWRRVDPAQLLQLELQTGAKAYIELAPDLAPLATANILRLAREKYFDGLSINRVQDNFVAQWGDPDGQRALGTAARTLPPEFSRDWPAALPVSQLRDADGYAPQTGFLAGMPVAGDRQANRLWGAHCYATVGVGRDNDENSGNGSELYVVIGHAPRQLDRNIAVVGRVIRGIEALSSLRRGTGALGFYETAAERTGIRSVRVVADLPAGEQAGFAALRTDSASFTALIEARRNRRDDWYKVPAGHVDLCNLPLPVRDAL